MNARDEFVKELQEEETKQRKERRIAAIRKWFAVATFCIVGLFLLAFFLIGPFYDWLEKESAGPIRYGFGTKELTMQIIQAAMLVMALGTAAILVWWYRAYEKDIEKL